MFVFWLFRFCGFFYRRKGCLAFLAFGALAPIGDFGFVDDKAVVFGWMHARGFADGAVDIIRFPAGAADEVVMVVAGAAFKECRGAGGLDAAEKAFVCEKGEGIVNSLLGDGSDFIANSSCDLISSKMLLRGDSLENRNTLGSYGDTVFA